MKYEFAQSNKYFTTIMTIFAKKVRDPPPPQKKNIYIFLYKYFV